MIVGTPGGSRIISMVMLAAVHFISHDKTAEQWINAPRFHHQFLPDVVQYEPGAFDEHLVKALEKRGHTLKPLDSTYGNMQAVYWDRKTGRVYAASDPRGGGEARVEVFNK